MKKATLIMVMFLAAACTKIAPPPQQTIDLGVQSQATSIKSIVQVNNTVTAVFETTPGAKYSVQVIPFGSEKPSFKEGFTASDVTTQKIYNLSTLSKSDYDLIFIDINGKEVKYPLVIK
jgi:hypothetical protein